MRNKLGYGVGGLCVIVGLALAWANSGCEEAKNVNGISVSPSSVTLNVASNKDATAVFTATVNGSLALPLEWNVSDPELGAIVNHSGSNAVYAANGTATGNNTVTVRDQYDNEGFATVHQQ